MMSFKLLGEKSLNECMNIMHVLRETDYSCISQMHFSRCSCFSKVLATGFAIHWGPMSANMMSK